MENRRPWNVRFMAITVALLAVATVPAVKANPPEYQISDIGVIDAGGDAS